MFPVFDQSKRWHLYEDGDNIIIRIKEEVVILANESRIVLNPCIYQ